MKNLFKKYLTQKVRNILSICIIIFGLVYIINYSFYRPTYINKYIAMNIYKAPANSAFTDQNFYNCVIDAYNTANRTSLGYTNNLSDSQLKTITYLNCDAKNILNVNGLEKMTSLTYLNIDSNQITSLDVSNNTLLRVLYANNNKLKSLNIDNSLALEKIDVHNNQLIYFEAKNNPSLVYLKLSGNNDLENVNINGAPALKELYFTDCGGFVLNNYATRCSYKTSIKELDISHNKELEILYLANSKLTSLDISHNSKLKKLGVEYNQLNYLDTSNNPDLDFLDVKYNNLTYFDVSNNLKLEYLNLYHNKLSNVDGLSELLLLKKLAINDNELTNINVSNSMDLSYLTLHENQLTNIDVSGNIALIELNISSNQLSNIDINKNTSLTSLSVSHNQLTSIDVSNNTALKYLDVSFNQLTSIDVSNNTTLIDLSVSHNKLTSLDVSNNTALTYLNVSFNQLINLDVSNNTALIYLYVFYNQLTSIGVSNNTALKYLDVSFNQLTSIDVSNNTTLIDLSVSHNKLTSLDLSNNTTLTDLGSSHNQLTSLDLSNHMALTKLYINNNNFNNVLTRYVGDSGKTKSAVKLPSHLDQSITWYSENEKIAISDSDGNIVTKKVGTVNIVGENKYYTTKTIVNVFEMTSDKYDIDNENLYIYVGSDNDVDTIKNNINVPDYITPNIDLKNDKIQLIKNNIVIKEFKIIRLASNNYKISNDYIYTRHYSDISGLSCYNCNASIEDNNVIIKYNDIEIDRFKLVKFSNKYPLYCIGCSDGAGIYTGMDNDEIIINNLAIINGNAIIDNNKLKITYNDNVLDEFDIRGFSTNYKVVDNNILYTGFNEFNINNINYRGDKVTGKYSNNKFTVLYNNIANMGSYSVISLSENNMSISRKNIDTEEIDYDTFIDNLSVIDNISYKVIYNNEEVTSGDIPRNSILNIYYNNELIDKYYINRNYTFDIDDDVSVLEEESIIYDINVGFTKNNLLDKVDTNGETYILDKNMKPIEDNNIIKTGYIFRTIFENDLDNPLDYKLSVRGDVLGTGELSRENAQEIAKHIIKKNVIKEKEYLLAADYDNDGNIKMNDVIKMLRDKRNKENS